jgi:ATP-dependent helicase/nuclease subunit B
MHVYSIPASAPFLRTLIEALVDGRLVDGFEARTQPERLATATMYLPTRRAGRLAREVFLDVLGTDAAVLPRIVTLGDIDEEELAFAQATAPSSFAELEIAPALDQLPRRLVLAQLISAWAKKLTPDDPMQAPLVIGGAASTLALADDLARLMDDMATRGVEWRALDGLVPDDLDQYWQMTLRFLKIAAEIWPPILAERQMIEPALRRDHLIEAEAARLALHRDGPVIAAGSTGSMPATARLLHAIARLPEGAVVLPGLDTDLDDAAWALIDGDDETPPASNHPQFALQGLLIRFGIARKDVVLLGDPFAHRRELLVSEAMRPSNASAHWHARLADPAVDARIAAGMTSLAVIAADNQEMEALAIAVAMREAHEREQSAALVTPDRALARRVIAALGRWQVDVDDSGGDSLMDTSAGIFARLIADAACDGLEPATLLALLKHPLLRLGRKPNGWRRAVQTLELALLRGTRPSAGSAGLANDFQRFREDLARHLRGEVSSVHPSEPRARLSAHALDDAGELVAAFNSILAPFEDCAAKPSDFSDVARCHRAAVEALARDDSDEMSAFAEAAGSALSGAFDDVLMHNAPSGLIVTQNDYADVFQAAFADRTVRRPQVLDARLRIYGPLEARLTQSDRVILGGLVEGIWPPAPRVDPWLSRPMRHALGLDLPERRIGLSAHDFAQMLGQPEVILSYSAKVAGAPAVASRFLHRLEAVAGQNRWEAAKTRGATYLHFADALDRPAIVSPCEKPKPKPPREARPLRMSVTAIEDWLRDPYTIYARQILKLQPLDPVDMPLSAADRGMAIHNAIADFTQEFSGQLPDDPEAELRRCGVEHFTPLMERPEARALWWPRYLRIASWIAGWEAERRAEVTSILAETRGEIAIPLDGDRVFFLSARADRIEHRRDRTYAIVDYKTGNPPTGKQVRMGLSPQLTLEGAILREGGFDGIPAGSTVSELTYVRLSGNSPPGKQTVLELKRDRAEEAQFPDDAAIEARAKLEALIRRFENEATPYQSLDLPMWSNRYGVYDDLARIKEWSAASGGDES